MPKVSWVKYKNMGGPLYKGDRVGRTYFHKFHPEKPWDHWDRILGVVSRCEGKHDTVVMYDETGVTFGAFQWTFKSGRLQKLIEYMKSVPAEDTEDSFDHDTLFDRYFVEQDGDGKEVQIFEEFGFRITGGKFFDVAKGRALNMTKPADRKRMVDVCMGRVQYKKLNHQKAHALSLCSVFADLGAQKPIQHAMVDFAKAEFQQKMRVKRRPLKDVGGTIKCFLPDELVDTPVPAIFWNLFQNMPAGAFKLFKKVWKKAVNAGIAFSAVGGMDDDGYALTSTDDQFKDEFLDILWKELNRSSYADWGFGSKQYLASKGKNPPRIVRLQPAIEEFYGLTLPYYKKG